MSGKKIYLVPLGILLAALVAAAVWLALPRIQVMRADALLNEANASITEANELLSGVDLKAVSYGNFVSLENIRQTSEVLSTSVPVIDEAIARIDDAIAKSDEAASLSSMPQWYRDYLGKKRQVATLRREQLETMKEAVGKLQSLYGDGDVIFTTIEEMDRLWGQVEYNLGILQSSPSEAGAGLKQAAASMRQLQGQLDGRFQQTGFELLDELADSVDSNAKLAELAGQLADAVAGGSQSQAQEAAVAVEAQLMETTDTSSFIELWLSARVKPLIDDFLELQEEQEELDDEAAELFEQNR